MANLYGVANCPGQPVQALAVGGADVVCNPGAETNVVTSSVLIAPSNGFFYAMAWGIITLAIGTPAPANVTIGIRVGAGADTMQFGVNTFLLVANTALMIPIGLFTPESTVPWTGLGSTVSIGINPQTNPITCRVQGTSVSIGLMRGMDA